MCNCSNMPKKHPLGRKDNSLDICNTNESVEICAQILGEAITSIASPSYTKSSRPITSITEEGSIEQNETSSIVWSTSTKKLGVVEGTASVVLFDKDYPVGTGASFIRFENENPAKMHYKEMMPELDVGSMLKPRYISERELNTPEEIAEIENNVRINDTLAMLRAEDDDSDDSYTSDDAERFFADDDEHIYECRPIYSNKPLVNNRTLDSMSHDSLIALLDFDMGDDDCSTFSASASTKR